MAGAGFGLKLYDAAFGTNHYAPFAGWLQYARGAYLDLERQRLPSSLTVYYDPLLDIHLRGPAMGGLGVAFYLAPMAPSEARALYEAAMAGTLKRAPEAPLPPHPRAAAQAMFLAREWAVPDVAPRIATAVDASLQPTWDSESGEFTWGCGLDEPYPRGQYNAFLAAAEAVSEGAWQRVVSGPPEAGEGMIEGIDFPAVSCREARWHDGGLNCILAARSASLIGSRTRFRVSGLPDPEAWHVAGPAGVSARPAGPDLLVETPVTSELIRISR